MFRKKGTNLANTQFDFALDADDPSTARQSAFMVNPPFSRDLLIKNMDTQKSFLITDVRLRSITRENESSIYGLDQWALDVYHKLAGYESQPGINTRVVDQMGHDIYDRYDNRSITPDTPTQKTIYRLSAREVDLLVHAGAYDDPAGTEARLRKNLVGQTWSMPDQVQVSESHVRIPDPKSAIVLGDAHPSDRTRDFVVALVQDTGKKLMIDAHTPGSNMAVVMDTALRQMNPGVIPMADVHNDLQAANDVKSLSKDHQIKSQILDSELDFDSVPKHQDEELDLNAPQIEASDIPQSDSPLMDHTDATAYREDLTLGAAKKAGLDKDQGPSRVEDQEAVAQDQSDIDEFLPDADNTLSHIQPSANSQVSEDDAYASEANTENQMFDTADDEQLLNTQTLEDSSSINQANKKQQKRQTIRTKEQTANNAVTAQSTEPVSQSAPTSQSAPESQAFDYGDLDNMQAPSMDQLQSILSQLQQEGVTKGYQAPNYDRAAEESPATQREKLKLQRRLKQQEAAEKSAVAAEAQKSREKQNRKVSNVPKFDDGLDL